MGKRKRQMTRWPMPTAHTHAHTEYIIVYNKIFKYNNFPSDWSKILWMNGGASNHVLCLFSSTFFIELKKIWFVEPLKYTEFSYSMTHVKLNETIIHSSNLWYKIERKVSFPSWMNESYPTNVFNSLEFALYYMLVSQSAVSPKHIR